MDMIQLINAGIQSVGGTVTPENCEEAAMHVVRGMATGNLSYKDAHAGVDMMSDLVGKIHEQLQRNAMYEMANNPNPINYVIS